ncbi:MULTISPECIES: SsgA family sporulation/cell division regulator [unclassified Streptomyces]|uniref:SsgA family sporulation/cell division regulator n=1 Tax=unclassified Streptomyces TaxID=2593676 RepID=UPI002962318F|nr:SsgA family sporulation/cell division regulator [Streptomyces sp. N50]WOX12318.1 SsgA family sporulation/cell division regulator [Streptomyces sp. N50]WSX14213.1 SsgA family sporulation/cell division regulator [Streptomyces sp. NBC_00988]WSX58519.1 SsgA family sporulation/cell division regulator [Streptomyces sp. NBC_00986]
MRHVTLEQPTSARLIADDDQELAVTVTLRYSSGDPFAVQLLFPAWISLDGKKVTWTFARALLEEGLATPAGMGNVHIRPYGPAHTAVEFHSPEGIAMIRFDTVALHHFLRRTYRVTEPGREALEPSLDRGLASLLDGA